MVRRMRSKHRSRDYEVGYGKPPKHSQFKKGQSGNPKGRPKGARNFKTDVLAMLQSRITINKEGKPRRVTAQEAYVLRLMEKALKGDARAMSDFRILAQTFNNDESIAEKDLSASEEALLEVYNERLLSGTIATAKEVVPETANSNPDAPDENHPETDHSGAVPDQPGKRQIARVRLNRKGPDAGEGDAS